LLVKSGRGGWEKKTKAKGRREVPLRFWAKWLGKIPIVARLWEDLGKPHQTWGVLG